MNKLEELRSIKKLVKQRMSEEERIWALGNIASNIILRLAKELIRSSGYSTVITIIQRELREIGKKDAKKIMKIFELNQKSPENASKILKIASILLGMDLDIREGSTAIIKCPYGECVKEFKQPFYCQICTEYCKGLIEGVIGKGYRFKQIKSIVKGDEYCTFQIEKK